MEHYFVIGFEHCEMVTEEEMNKRINEEYYGNPENAFHNVWPKERDPNYWDDKYVVIKGKFCSPQPVEVIKNWKMNK